MASILKVGDAWRAQVRRKGYKSISETFSTKAQAVAWARKIEAEMDARRFNDTRGLANITVKKLIDWYFEEVGTAHQFGKNKIAVLLTWQRTRGHISLADSSADYLTTFVRDRRKAGASGITISIDLTYLGSVFKSARDLRKLPLDLEPLNSARANMAHLKISTKSNERARRPTEKEISDLCDYLDKHSSLPMRDIIHFATESAMRVDEITRLRWIDLNETDRTIIIRDRKHPRQKQGNDQEVPLLGKTYEIIQRQPRPAQITCESRIFPVKVDTITTIFPRAKNALGIKDLHFHDLRHEGVSRLFEQGYQIHEVALVSGHRDWKMLARYTKIKAKDLHHARTKP
ncbi:tyrosine-type recombinase/integrase [Massilia aerilata]|uniref:Tyrosine-type recombinase/integrase n=1 Tax=Massilia aerilata TaxID=453817 RepID=A0ABW0S153_9BURK